MSEFFQIEDVYMLQITQILIISLTPTICDIIIELLGWGATRSKV